MSLRYPSIEPNNSCLTKSSFSKAVSLALQITSDRGAATAFGSLFRCLIIFSIKNMSLISNLYVAVLSFQSLALVMAFLAGLVPSIFSAWR